MSWSIYDDTWSTRSYKSPQPRCLLAPEDNITEYWNMWWYTSKYMLVTTTTQRKAVVWFFV